MAGLEARLRRHVLKADTRSGRILRAVIMTARKFTLPVPRPLGMVLLGLYRLVDAVWGTAFRLLVCEPLLKARCSRYGTGVRANRYIHWIRGPGILILGDGVHLDGKSSVIFARRFAEKPTLEIGPGTYVGHNCSFGVGQRITIGERCLIAGDCRFSDSNGHPLDPNLRAEGQPPTKDEVRPITIGNNVWIATGATLLPGVIIGDGSVVATRAVVTGSFPERSLIAGIPAKLVRLL